MPAIHSSPESESLVVPTQDAVTACADLLRVLADKTRLMVVQLLMKGPQTVGQLNETLGVEQSLLSHHLKLLRDTGLVVTKREGKSVRYRLEQVSRSAGLASIQLGCCVLTFDENCGSDPSGSGPSSGCRE